MRDYHFTFGAKVNYRGGFLCVPLGTLRRFLRFSVVQPSPGRQKSHAVGCVVCAIGFAYFLVYYRVPNVLGRRSHTIIPFKVNTSQAGLLVYRHMATLAMLGVLPYVNGKNNRLLRLILQRVRSVGYGALNEFNSSPQGVKGLLGGFVSVTTMVFRRGKEPPPEPPEPPIDLSVATTSSSSA